MPEVQLEKLQKALPLVNSLDEKIQRMYIRDPHRGQQILDEWTVIKENFHRKRGKLYMPKPERKKGLGYLGSLPTTDDTGRESTEISIGVNFDGKEMEIPSLVPTLNKSEIDYLLAGNKPTKEIVNKATAHAKKRISEGKNVFAQKGEQPKVPSLIDRVYKKSEEAILKGVDWYQKFRSTEEEARKTDNVIDVLRNAAIDITAIPFIATDVLAHIAGSSLKEKDLTHKLLKAAEITGMTALEFIAFPPQMIYETLVAANLHPFASAEQVKEAQESFARNPLFHVLGINLTAATFKKVYAKPTPKIEPRESVFKEPEVKEKPIIEPPKEVVEAKPKVEIETPKSAVAEIIEGKAESTLGTKEFKQKMVIELDNAIKKAPDEIVKGKESIEIHIPGDGDFKIPNTKEVLEATKKNVLKLKDVEKPTEFKQPAHTKPTGERLRALEEARVTPKTEKITISTIEGKEKLTIKDAEKRLEYLEKPELLEGMDSQEAILVHDEIVAIRKALAKPKIEIPKTEAAADKLVEKALKIDKAKQEANPYLAMPEAEIREAAANGTVDAIKAAINRDIKFKPKSTFVKEQYNKLKSDTAPAMASIERVTDVKVSKEIPVEVVRKDQIIKDLEKGFNIPARVGKLGGGRQRKLGIFKVKPEVVRTKIANDIEVAAHEYGHALQKQLFNNYFKTREGGFAKWAEEVGIDKKAVLSELRDLDYSQSKGGRRTSEGFAEFIRHYINGSENAKKIAPNLFQAFEKRMIAEPEIHQVLLRAREDWQRWRDQEPVAQVLSQISINEKERSLPTFSDIYTYSIDDLNPLRKMRDELVKTTPIEVAKDPYINARLMRGWGGTVEHYFQKGQLDINGKIIGKSLNEILKPIEKDMNNFRAYAVAKRSQELAERFPEKSMEELTGLTKRAVDETVVLKESEIFNSSLEKLYEYQDNLLTYVKDSGFLNKEQYQKIKKVNRFYVPFYRIIETEAQRGAGGTFGSLGKPVKKIKGSGRRINDPIESIIKNTYTLINLSKRNRIGTMLAEMSEIEGAGKWIEKVQTPIEMTKIKLEEIDKELEKIGMGTMSIEGLDVALENMAINIFRPSKYKPAENHIFVHREGKREYYQLHPEVYKAVQALNSEQVGWLAKTLAVPARWLRAGATLTPEFMARNPIRDNFTAYVYSQYGFKPGIDFVKGIFHVVGKSDLFWKFKAAGADHSMLVSMDRKYLQKGMKDVLRTRRQKFFNRMLDPLDTLRKFSEYMEAGTRVGEFRRGIKKEGDTISGRLKSAFAAREVTLDFGMHGAKTKEPRLAVAFLNAQLLGIDKAVREFKNNPKQALVRSITGITIPSIALYLLNKDDEDYQNLASWQKDLFWLIKMPKGFNKINVFFGDDFLRIPKPFELGILFGSLPERILGYIEKNDPGGFIEFADSFFESLVPDLIPTAVKPLVENFANYNRFYNSPIVPKSLEEVEPYMQYMEYTSESAKEIGKLINYPPAKIDNLVRGWFAGLGQYVTGGTDAIIRTVKGAEIPEEPEQGLRTFPLIKGFIARYPSSNMLNVDKFYEEYEKTKRAYFSYKHLEKIDQEKADKYYNKNEVLIENYETTKNISKLFSDIRKEIKIIYNSNKSAEEKRKEIDGYYYMMSDLLKENYK